MDNLDETLMGRGAFCLWHLGFSLPMITLLHLNQRASGKMRLARVVEDEYPQALICENFNCPVLPINER